MMIILLYKIKFVKYIHYIFTPQTAVHCATQNRDSQSLQILLDHGGDLYRPDVFLKTPLDYIQGNLQCQRVVRQHLSM